MRVAVDLEDVILDTNEVFIRKMNGFLAEEFPESEWEASTDNVSEWGMTSIAERLAELMGWQKEVPNKFFYGEGKWSGYVPITENIWEEEADSIPLMEENIESKLRQIKESTNREIHLVTARKRVGNPIESKLEAIGVREIFDKIVIESDKHELPYDIFIDDNPTLSENLDREKIQLIRQRPWNRKTDLQKPNRRIKNLDEAAEVIQNLGAEV